MRSGRGLAMRRCMDFFFFQAEDGIRDLYVTGVQTCALPISQYAKRFQIILPFANGHELERRPGAIQPEKIFFQVSSHGFLRSEKRELRNATLLYLAGEKWLEITMASESKREGPFGHSFKKTAA